MCSSHAYFKIRTVAVICCFALAQTATAFAEVRVTVSAYTDGAYDQDLSYSFAAVASHWPGVSVVERRGLAESFQERAQKIRSGDESPAQYLSGELLLELRTRGGTTYLIETDAQSSKVFFADRCEDNPLRCSERFKSHLRIDERPFKGVSILSNDASLEVVELELMLALFSADVPLVNRRAIEAIHNERLLLSGGISTGHKKALSAASLVISLQEEAGHILLHLVDATSGRLLETAKGTRSAPISNEFVESIKSALQHSQNGSDSKKIDSVPATNFVEATFRWQRGVISYARGDRFSACSHFLRALDTSPSFDLARLWLLHVLSELNLLAFRDSVTTCVTPALPPPVSRGTLLIDQTDLGLTQSDFVGAALDEPVRLLAVENILTSELDALVGTGEKKGVGWLTKESSLSKSIAVFYKNGKDDYTLISSPSNDPGKAVTYAFSAAARTFKRTGSAPAERPNASVNYLDTTAASVFDENYLRSLAASSSSYGYTEFFAHDFSNLKLQRCLRNAAIREEIHRHPDEEGAGWLLLVLAGVEPSNKNSLLKLAAAGGDFIPARIAQAILDGRPTLTLPDSLLRRSTVLTEHQKQHLAGSFDPRVITVHLSAPNGRRAGKVIIGIETFNNGLFANSDPDYGGRLPSCPFLDPDWISKISLEKRTTNEQFDAAKQYFASCMKPELEATGSSSYAEGMYMLALGFLENKEYGTAQKILERIVFSTPAESSVIDRELIANALFRLAVLEKGSGNPALALRYAQQSRSLCGDDGFHLLSSIRRWSETKPLLEYVNDLLSDIRREGA